MYSITTEQSFDSAHFLKDYIGKCHNLHGHRWRVIIEIAGEELNTDTQTRGMLRDFSDVKSDLEGICDSLDHALIYETDSLKATTIAALKEEDFRLVEVGFRPTAENFARFFYDEMSKKGYDVLKAQVYETPNNCASYSE